MRVFGRAILLKAAFVVMSCDSPIVEDDPWEPEPELLSEAESAEVATAFVDAACFCQAFLGMNYGTDSHVHSQLKDMALLT